ncbi:Mitochondrial carrier protein [Carpediemonas membranifera]|uniref:Mitochondrial carrier protein n=1 Tax=Carpediemonas membranifera TaxID=201153 RepID=A0A8J6EAJ7_9EUKA|nr:Mitochondrial carrier protein [Carpediemonas membranifera]|eukprot:KAG9394795.1 Mitochondrial carrier protein [Carpediemonas membranifera]
MSNIGSNPLIHFAAGATSATIACVSCQPMDLIKTRLQQSKQTKDAEKYSSVAQAARTIIQEDGITGLWRGSTSNVMRVVPGAGLYFLMLQMANRRYRARTGHAMTPLHALLTGSFARAATAVIANPAAVAKSRMESVGVWEYKNGRSAVIDVLKTSYTRGAMIQVLGDVIYSGISFAMVNTTSPFAQKKASPTSQFIVSAVAGAVGTAAAYPLDVVRTRVALSKAQGKDAGIVAVVREMLEEEGIAPLYRGVEFVALRRAITTAVTWSSYRAITAAVGRARR